VYARYVVSSGGFIKERKAWKEVSKGVWGMPRLSEAKKDVLSCEKPWGVAQKL
jgi:hypothetical protein